MDKLGHTPIAIKDKTMKSHWLLLTTAALFLSACSSDDLEEELETINFGSDYYKNDYYLLNATDYELDYHIANTQLNGDERDVADDDYYLATLAKDAQQYAITHESNANRKLSLYVAARNVFGPVAQKKVEVEYDHAYHVVAWQNAAQINISLIEQQQDNQDNAYALRIFAAEPIQVSIKGHAFSLGAGELSAFVHGSDCDSDVKIAQKNVDLCTISFNRSYLLVANQQGLTALYTEQ
ncbi:hypothetical protein CWC05_01030 [Pseudoalteromonas ruthenica]|uniref:Uncharacterized protein n=2 Tax=Pseudoalteromonas TaxID=53246 RepID=A0A5S3Z9T3_9GAMM|nr:hypothetical protein CWC05_01030 [Pseudoalteromonas ruthenica]